MVRSSVSFAHLFQQLSGNMEMNQDSTRPRVTLTLANRIAVIEAFEKSKESMRVLANKYNCSLTQIKNVIRRKEEYMHEWNNNGDLTGVRKKQALCFLSVGTVVCEFVHRWKCYNQEITDDLLLKKGQEAAALLNTPEIRTTSYWLARIKKKFKIFDPPMYSTMKSLQMADIIMDLMDSYSPDSKMPQLLHNSVINRYINETEKDNYPYYGRFSETESTHPSSESSNDTTYLSSDLVDSKEFLNVAAPIIVQQEVILEGAIDITDVEDENDDIEDNSLNDDETVVKNNTSEVRSYVEAVNYLAPLEQFVLLQEDVRAIGLVNQLENLFKDKMKNFS